MISLKFGFSKYKIPLKASKEINISKVRKEAFLRLFLHKYAGFCIFMQCNGRRFAVQRGKNRLFGHKISHIEHQKTTIHIVEF